MYARVDDDDYDADQDDIDMSTRARGTTAALRMRGGGPTVVETVTEEDTEDGLEELEQPQPQPTQHSLIPTTTKKIQPPQKPKYDSMKDEPPPAIITRRMYRYGRRKMNIGAINVNQQRCVQSQISSKYIARTTMVLVIVPD